MDEEVYLHKILTSEQIAELHQMVKDHGGGPKLVISVFEESTLAGVSILATDRLLEATCRGTMLFACIFVCPVLAGPILQMAPPPAGQLPRPGGHLSSLKASKQCLPWRVGGSHCFANFIKCL